MSAPEKRNKKALGDDEMVSANIMQRTVGGELGAAFYETRYDDAIRLLLEYKDPRIIAAYALHLGAYVQRNSENYKISLGKLIGALNRKVLE